MDKDWFIYMVECSDKTLYTGITTDLDRRIEEHNTDSRGAKYTRSRRPVHMVYFEEAISRSEASKREYQIKQLTRKDKLNLIRHF
jgi:putative endonuclease